MLVHIVCRTRGLTYDLKISFTLLMASRNCCKAQQRHVWFRERFLPPITQLLTVKMITLKWYETLSFFIFFIVCFPLNFSCFNHLSPSCRHQEFMLLLHGKHCFAFSIVFSFCLEELLRALPLCLENISFLRVLRILDCKNLMRLPSKEAMQCLSNLQMLNVLGCSQLYQG